MSRALSCSLIVLLLASAASVAAPVVEVGDFVLRGETASQEIQVYVRGGDLVEASDLFLQIGDGTSGPTITSADIVSGTIFDGNVADEDPLFPNTNPHTEIAPGGRAVGILVAAAVDPDTHMTVPVSAGSSFVPGDPGLLATVVLDTTGLTTGTWDLRLSFDVAGEPYETVFPSVPTSLVDGTLSIGMPSTPGDFDLNGVFNAQDIDDFVQAIRNPAGYVTEHSLGPVDPATLFASIGDYDGSGTFDAADARVFADDPTGYAGAALGLPTRESRYLALDIADLDPALGSGSGNFFGTVFGGTLPTDYDLGESRADFNGDGILGADDIDYLFSQYNTVDEAADLNGDGLVDMLDADAMVGDVLGTHYGDATLDGRVTFSDFAVLRTNFGATAGWAAANFNTDGRVTFGDFALLRANFGAGPVPPPVMASAPVPEPSTVVLLLLGSIPLFWKFCRSNA